LTSPIAVGRRLEPGEGWSGGSEVDSADWLDEPARDEPAPASVEERAELLRRARPDGGLGRRLRRPAVS
jgi:hypothetical protein